MGFVIAMIMTGSSQSEWSKKGGDQHWMTFSEFYDFLFEIVDFWTDTTDSKEYVMRAHPLPSGLSIGA
jgi:hypothetical protein